MAGMIYGIVGISIKNGCHLDMPDMNNNYQT